MKIIKTVEKLIERAERKGVATLNRKVNQGYGVYYTSEVYRVEKEGNIFTLYHYETKTCQIDTATEEILYVYGESVSDADSIFTFLHYFDIVLSFGYKPVNGGFYASVNGKQIFIDDFDRLENFTKAIKKEIKTNL
ncbi:terminal repeat-encoded protein P [Enterococcus phage 9181]|nr:terminal repeat-encoded protein P [Enterococcus phage 9181]